MSMSAAQAMPSGMAGCHDKDMQQPSLCDASHKSEEKSLDKPPAPAVPAFVAVGFGFPIALAFSASIDLSSPPASPFLSYATAPPLAIRNCCFRI